MNITTKATHNITFSVEYFEEQEGGMDNETFGRACGTLKDAIHILQIAREAQPRPPASDWVIVCYVESKIE
jgi:hypothetical protein